MNASLRTRILLVVLFGGIAPLALVGFWIVRSGPQSGEDALRARLTETMEDIVGTTGQRWVVIRSSLLELVEDPAIRGLLVDPEAEDLRQGLQAQFARYDLADAVTALSFTGTDGNQVDLDPPGSRQTGSGPATVRVQVPVYPPGRGEKVGELLVRVRAESLLPSDFLLSGVGGSVLAAMDVDGSPVVRQPIEIELLALPRFAWRGERWLTVSQSLEEPPLHLVLAGPAGAFTEPFYQAARRGTLALVLGSLLALLLVWVGSDRVTRRLDSLTKASKAVAAGNLTVSVPESGPSELRSVARAFNTMSASLAQTLERATQRETLAALGEYAASLAHEVRNPLMAMRLDLERAAERIDDDDPSNVLVGRSLAELDRLDASLSGALKLARTGSLDLASIDIRVPVEAAMRAANPRFVGRGATLDTDRWPDHSVTAHADTAAVEQLVLNLLLNAADALGEGGAAHVSIEEKGNAIHIRVRDEGEGIPPDLLTRVFQPLYSTRPEGTGLGLPIARRIVRAHGGDLKLESEKGKGTSATAILPRAEGPEV
jgi:signal transduction histidine kinase